MHDTDGAVRGIALVVVAAGNAGSAARVEVGVSQQIQRRQPSAMYIVQITVPTLAKAGDDVT